jgi:Tol biopolymer transport system component
LDETNPNDLRLQEFLIGLWQSTPTTLGQTVNSSFQDWGPSISGDGRELYFQSNRPGSEGTYDIWVSMRATKDDEWGAPINLGAPVNTSDWDTNPCISADGLELYFNNWGLWVAKRATVSEPWGEPEKLSTRNINAWKDGGLFPSLSSDGLSLFFCASPWPNKDPNENNWHLYVSTRSTRDSLWSEPVSLGSTVNGVNSTSQNWSPNISPDGLFLVFSSDRPGGYGEMDLWVTRRSTTDGPWSEPMNLGPTINSGKWEVEPEISPDGRSLLFCSSRNSGHGDYDIWQAPMVLPVGNLKQDGDSDSAPESDNGNSRK